MIKYIKSVLWRVAKRLSYIEDARCLKVNHLSNYCLTKTDPAQWRWFILGFLFARTVHIYFCYSPFTVDRDSAVGIVTRYGLYVPGIESQWEAKFSAPVQTGPLGPTQLPIQWVPGLSRG